MPAGVELMPMPESAVRLGPETRDMQVVLTDKRVAVVEPVSRTVVALIGFDEKHQQLR
jgi:hypothetical protein